MCLEICRGWQDMCLTLTWEERNDSPLWILLASFHREFIQQFHLKRHSFPISMCSFHMRTYIQIHKNRRTTKGGGEFFLSLSNQQFFRGIRPINPARDDGRPEHMVCFYPSFPSFICCSLCRAPLTGWNISAPSILESLKPAFLFPRFWSFSRGIFPETSSFWTLACHCFRVVYARVTAGPRRSLSAPRAFPRVFLEISV